jgi:nitroreductase
LIAVSNREDESMNETLETMWRRRSVRKYKPDAIPEEHLNLILEAARRAPTGANRQSWRMVVVRDPDVRRKTAEACSSQMWMADAPVILCLVTLPDERRVSGTIVLDHAILAATGLGYGTCWIGSYDADKVKEVLGIPDDHGIVCLTPVGVPAEQPDPRPRKPPAELFMADRFGAVLDYSL